jgi:putative transposase
LGIYMYSNYTFIIYLDYSVNIKRMIYTTNWIERINSCCRQTLKEREAFQMNNLT